LLHAALAATTAGNHKINLKSVPPAAPPPILVGLGALFLVVIAFVSWLGVSSNDFRKEQAPFVQKFVVDLSKRWDVADVRDRMSVSFIEQADTQPARELLNQFKRLGALKSVQDLELRSFMSMNGKRTGIFAFKGIFENGDGAVRVTITQDAKSCVSKASLWTLFIGV